MRARGAVRRGRSFCTLALGVVAILATSAGSASATPGALTELAGKDGCVTQDGAIEMLVDSCTIVPEVGSVNSIVISPDGRFAYASGVTTDYGITTLLRNPSTGALAPLSGSDYCHTRDGSGYGGPTACTDARVVGEGGYEGGAMAMTDDGRFLYVGGYYTAGVAAFERDPDTGKLTQLAGAAGCYTADGSSEEGAGTCTDVRFMGGVYGIEISPDQNTVYVISSGVFDFGVTILRRDPATGALTQPAGDAGCWSESGDSDDDGPNTCEDLNGGGYSNTFAMTPDGRHAYLSHYNHSSVAILDVDPATGLITQDPSPAGCISDDGSSEEGAGTCTDVGALTGAWSEVVSADGRVLYVALYGEPGVAAFNIGADGHLTPLPGTSHCITNDGDSSLGAGTCADGRGFESAEIMRLSADGASLYATQWRGLNVMSVDPATGALTQLPGVEGCLTNDGESEDGAGTCEDIRGNINNYGLTLSPDDRFVYLTAESGGGSITAFAREVPPPPPPPPPSPDTTAPACTAPKKLNLGKRVLKVKCDEAAKLKAKVSVPGSGKKAKRVTIAKGNGQATAGAAAKVKLKLTKKGKRTLKGLKPAKVRKLKAKLALTATDAAGNRAKVSRKIRLKP